jgi:hypothetical protein
MTNPYDHKPPTPASRRRLFDARREAIEAVAEIRSEADRLISEDGGADARRKAKSLRCGATRLERSTDRIVAFCDADFAHDLALSAVAS